MKALIVEDDKATADFVSSGLEPKGFECDWEVTGESALEAMVKNVYDIAIVDITLNKRMSGLELIRLVREKKINTPIIVLSAMNAPADKISGLNCGADDYLGKPFARSELLARVDAQIRRTSYIHDARPLQVEEISIRPETREAFRGGRRLDLTSGEFALLELLVRNAGRMLSTRTILQRVWNVDNLPSSKIVETRICTLRKKLCAGGEPNMIFTNRGFGYVLR